MLQKMLLLTVCLCMVVFSVDAQLMKKLKEKVNEKVNEAAEKVLKTSSGNSNNGSSESGTSGSGENSNSKPTNSRGGGLVSTPPDIKTELGNALASFQNAQYAQSRFSLQQAILGAELLIGKQVLESLPIKAGGLMHQPASDKVSSNGWGWAGLSIHREYIKDDQMLTVAVQDYSFYGAAWAMYLDNGFVNMQSNTSGPQSKRIQVKGNKAVISYDDSKGYTVAVLLNQGTALVWEGVNFASENDMMAVVNEFDVNKIKSLMGEK